MSAATTITPNCNTPFKLERLSEKSKEKGLWMRDPPKRTDPELATRVMLAHALHPTPVVLSDGTSAGIFDIPQQLTDARLRKELRQDQLLQNLLNPKKLPQFDLKRDMKDELMFQFYASDEYVEQVDFCREVQHKYEQYCARRWAHRTQRRLLARCGLHDIDLD